jgi:hypothetical protein
LSNPSHPIPAPRTIRLRPKPFAPGGFTKRTRRKPNKRMKQTKAGVVALALGMAGVALVLFLQQRQVGRLQAENAALQRQAANLARRSQGEPAAVPAASKADPGRLADQQRELLRLRGELARLRNHGGPTAAGSPATGAPPAADATAGQAGADPVPFAASGTASVRSGESFATGGWTTAPGTRTFFLATPTLTHPASDATNIAVAMCLLKVPEGDLPPSLLQHLAPSTGGESPILTGADAALLVAKLKASNETNIVSRPQVVTADGVPASMFIGETRPNPDGTQREIGTRIDLSPQVAGDGQTIRLGVSLEYVPREDQPEEDGSAKSN